jgi:hypothetical protein
MVPRSMLLTGAELALEKWQGGGRAGEAVGVELLRVCARSGTRRSSLFSPQGPNRGAAIDFFYSPILWIRLTGIQPGR